jgi:hypothetical protein
MAMTPGLYSLIEPIAFTIPISPGALPVYQNFAPPAIMKMVDYAFERDKNYYLSYSNIIGPARRRNSEQRTRGSSS